MFCSRHSRSILATCSLAQRDRAHYQAYQALTIAMCLLWLVTDFEANIPKMLARVSFPVGAVVYGLATVLLVVSITLPQAILLWTEPDMEADFPTS